jgi:6-phosphogluconolactonase
MIRETLLSHVPLSPSNIHRIYTEAGDPQKAAIAYAGELASVFAPDRVPRFDIVLLGIGSDGHTASLFPGSPALASTGTVEAVHAPVDGRVRITLTLRVINNARTVLVLVSGREKAKVLHEVMSSGEESPVLPAAMVKPENGELYWFVSADAATLLTDSK